MIRAISIVLIVAIALQTVGCSSWKPLARANEVSEDKRESSMREQVLGKLKEGKRVRIRIREGARTRIKGRMIDCIIDKIGHTTLTVVPFTPYAGGNNRREYSLRYADIICIEFRESQDLLPVFVAGAILGLFAVGFVFLPPWN